MTISAADDRIFILSDEIIAHIYSFFPSPNGHDEKTSQACAALQALINVIGVVLCQINCANCRELTPKTFEISLARMLKDAPDLVLNLKQNIAHKLSTEAIGLAGL